MRERNRCLIALLAALAVSRIGAQPTAPHARIVEDLRLDATKEDFSAVNRVYVGPRKQIVVALPQDHQLRWYDSDGKRIGTAGRRGAGPGEFNRIAQAGWVGDTLWVHDNQMRRTTFVGPDAGVLRTTVLPPRMTIGTSSGGQASMLMHFMPLAVHADGSMTGEGGTSVKLPSGKDRFIERLVKLAPSGAATVVHALPPLDDPRWSIDAGGSIELIPFRMPPQGAESWDGTRFATMTADLTTADGGTFTVALMRMNGETVFTRTYPFTGIPIPKHARDSALAKFMAPPSASYEDQGASRPQVKTPRPNLPTVYTPLSSIILGIDNTVWITMRATTEGRTVLVLNSRGDPIGSVLLPPRTTIRQASINDIWTTEADADGLTSVVRYKVSGITCGAACR